MDRRAEVAAKLELARAWMARQEVRGLLLTGQANFAWATAGGHNHVSLGRAEGVASVLITGDAGYVCTNNIERARIVNEETDRLPFEVAEWPWYQPERARVVIDEICPAESVVSDVGSFGLAVADASVAGLRRTLLPPEVDRYRSLGVDASQALEATARAVRPGDRELDVAARLASECRKRDILDLVNLVGADERIAAYRHPIPTANTVQRVVLVALTGRRHGLHASLTRMVSFGPPDPELTARHQAVLRVDTRQILESRPGAEVKDVMMAGARQYESEGFPDEWHHHHQGGPTGYAGREVLATPTSHYRLGANQAVAWNPSITRVKSEDTVLVTGHGPEVLTRTGSWPEHQVRISLGSMARPAILEAGTEDA